MDRLVINLATRLRPGLLLETVRRTLPNISEKNTALMISIDDDDTETVKASSQLLDDPRIHVSIKPREDSFGGKYNRVLTEFPDFSVALPMCDYAPHITPGFDTRILEAASLFPDGIGVVYNHMANLSFPDVNGVTAKFAEKMGYLYPPYFPYWFVDHWVDDIAKLIGRISFADVTLDKSKRPGTHDRREVAWWATFYDAGVVHRRNLARSIVESPDFIEPEWRKKLLLSDYHMLIEGRSKMTNDTARMTQWGKAPEAIDDRYRRIKSKAQGLLREWLPELEAEQALRMGQKVA